MPLTTPTTPPWDTHSGVTTCPFCEGTGTVRAARAATIADPYPEDPCECGRGEHLPSCDVCGFMLEVPGFDCLACATVGELREAALRVEDLGPHLMQSIGRAFLAAQAWLYARETAAQGARA